MLQMMRAEGASMPHPTVYQTAAPTWRQTHGLGAPATASPWPASYAIHNSLPPLAPLPCLQPAHMLHSVPAGCSTQLSEAARAGACALWGTLPALLARSSAAPPSAAVQRGFAGLAATGYPKPDVPAFQYAVLEAPLMQQHEGAPALGTIPRHLLPFAQRMAALGGRRAAGGRVDGLTQGQGGLHEWGRCG